MSNLCQTAQVKGREGRSGTSCHRYRAGVWPHNAELKARVLAECVQQGASVATVVTTHGLNANLVHM